MEKLPATNSRGLENTRFEPHSGGYSIRIYDARSIDLSEHGGWTDRADSAMMKAVRPATWVDLDGNEAQLIYFADRLIILATPDHHAEIADWFDAHAERVVPVGWDE